MVWWNSGFAILVASTATLALAMPHEHNHDGWRPGQDSVRLLYQYPVGTWIENIAVRSSGELLLTILSSPRLDQLDPFSNNAEPETIYTFPNASGVTGVAEIDHDVFTTTVGTFSLTGGGSVPGSWSVWKADFNRGSASVDRITGIPELVFPNGMCNLPSTLKPHDILIGDIDTGKIWRLDPSTGEHEVVISNALTSTEANPIFGTVGVDGIHVRGQTLYFTNAGQSLFASMPIHPDGTPAGSPHIIGYFFNSTQYADDFALDNAVDDAAYLVTGSGNSIERVDLDSMPKARIISGSLNSTMIAEPTACAFGRTKRDAHVLYVVTAGGLASPVDGDEVVGGQVLAVDTRRWRAY